jgi:hypothetical protein
MERDDLDELQFITHVGNLPSIAKRGILCHRRAARIPHEDVSLADVQDRRKGVRVPSGLLLHDYANVFITARNPMLSRLLFDGRLDDLCVVSVSPEVLDLQDVVVTDRNAAASLCRFRTAAEGLAEVDAQRVACQYWRHDDPLEEDQRKNTKFAEVLVPQVIERQYLRGSIYVGSAAAGAAAANTGVDLEITTDRYLFLNFS